MKAKKENKVYEVDKVSKDRYVKLGYDIYDDGGKLIEIAKNKSVAYGEYEKLQRELESAKKVPNNAKALREKCEELEVEKESLQEQLSVANDKITGLEVEIESLQEQLSVDNDKVTELEAEKIPEEV